MERTYLRGVGVFPFASEQELIDYVERRPGILVAVNAEKIIHADDELRGLINRNIGYCDGAGAVKGLRKKGHGDVSKIAGCELWLKIIERMYRERTFYLVGGRQEVIDQTVEKLRSQFDGIRIVGYRNGYIADDEQCEALLDDIARKSPTSCSSLWARPGRSILWSACSSVIRRYIRVWAAASTYTPDTSSVLRSGG